MRAYVLVLLAACADPAIEMHLETPSGSAASIDLSCVTAVTMTAVGNQQGDANHAPDRTDDCYDLPHAPASFDDLAGMMHGRFSSPLPSSGLLGVQVAAVGGHCNDQVPLHEAMVYGGAPYRSGSMTIPLVPNISCAATAHYTVRAIDLLAAGTCTPITTAGAFDYAADIRPAMLGPDYPAMFIDYGTSAAVPAADGTAPIDSFNAISGPGCIAAGYADNTNFIAGVTCVDVAAPTLCSPAGTVEVGVIQSLMVSFVDTPLATQFGTPTFATVWDATTKTAISGATVTIDDGLQGQVVYGEPASSLATHAAPTGTSGFFMVYGKGAIGVTVSAPGHRSQHYIVAGEPIELHTLIAVLPAM